MAALITTGGLTSLGAWTGTLKQWLNSLTLHLFQNNHTPTVTDTIAAVTEATFDNYAPVVVGDYGVPTLDGNNNAVFAANDVSWLMLGNTTPNIVYGQYWTDMAGALVLIEDNGGGFPMSAAGYEYTVSPRFYLGQILPPL